MKRIVLAALSLAPLFVLILACSSEPTGPERTLRTFYDNLNAGEYASAIELYDDDFREFLEDPAQSGMSFADWARTETKNGTVDDLRVLKETAGPGTSQIEFEVEYADGSRNRRKVSLTEVGGEWRLGGIS
jgi:hypothetical protein